MRALLAEKEMDNVRFEIEEADALPIDPVSGKFRLVVRQSPSTAPPSLPERSDLNGAAEETLALDHLVGSVRN